MKTFSVFLVASCLSLSGCASLESLWDSIPEPSNNHSVVVPSRTSSDLFPKKSEQSPAESKFSSSSVLFDSLDPVGTAPTPGYEQNELLKKKAEKRKKLDALYRSIQQ